MSMVGTGNNQYEIGKKILSGLDKEVLARLIKSLESISPDFAKIVVEFPFGQIYAREGLSLKQRELISIIALATLGNAKIQFQDHLRFGLKAGLSKLEITEALIQLSVFAGFPVALNGLMLAQEVFLEFE